jgi:hypothetical protein
MNSTKHTILTPSVSFASVSLMIPNLRPEQLVHQELYIHLVTLRPNEQYHPKLCLEEYNVLFNFASIFLCEDKVFVVLFLVLEAQMLCLAAS